MIAARRTQRAAFRGVPLASEIRPTQLDGTRSLQRAKRIREDATIEASAPPRAEQMAKPSKRSPDQAPKYRAERSANRDVEVVKRTTPAASVPNPSVSAAVTTVNTTPAPRTLPIKTRGMVNLDFLTSSPSVATCSKPAKERRPNESPRAIDEAPTPAVGMKRSRRGGSSC